MKHETGSATIHATQSTHYSINSNEIFPFSLGPISVVMTIGQLSAHIEVAGMAIGSAKHVPVPVFASTLLAYPRSKR
jgi:hypothetical protein